MPNKSVIIGTTIISVIILLTVIGSIEAGEGEWSERPVIIYSGIVIATIVWIFTVASAQKQKFATKAGGTLQDMLYDKITNWKNWAILLIALYIYFSVRLGLNRGSLGLYSFAEGLIYIFFVGVGLLYYPLLLGFEKIPQGIPQGAMWGFWPSMLFGMFLILKRKLNKKNTVILGVILFILLVLAFHGCASTSPGTQYY
ncbi:hypothetical protein J4475_03030 [Candidatus Woesearchaeota archaeon]|nr:hypothetical protein [Candidatus Woesearchaeota archaeon]